VSVDTNGRDGADVLGYRTEAVIGRGGMGVVYRAQDVRLRRTVALKVMAPELARDERFRERFVRESELAMSLEHPNVVPIHDAGEADGRLYLVMRCVEGTDLRALLRAKGALAPERTLAIVRQVADALDAAHALGLVHRDVKPSNVLLDVNEHVYLADFGLTRRLSEEGRQLGDSASLGTPAYLAPEQIEGRLVDGRADVYALGCLLYECLTGEPPFSGSSRLAVAWAHLEEDPPSACERNLQLPQAIDPVVWKAMTKEPEDRYATCTELVVAAAAALGLRRRVSWRRRALLLAATVMGLAALAAAFAARASDDAASPPVLGPNKLIRVDPATNSVAAIIDVGEFPSGVAIGGDSVWVYNLADRTVSEIDARTNEVVQTTRVSTVPTDVGAGAGPVLAADAEGAWVIGRVGNESVLTRIGSDGHGTRERRLEGELKAIAVGEGAIWILGHRGRSDSIIRVDPRSGVVTRRTRMPDGFAGAAVSAAARRASSGRLDGLAVGGGSVWAAATQAGTLYRVDPTTSAVRLRDLGGVTLRPVFGFGRVWMCVDGTMQRIDPRTLRDSRSGTGLGGEREYVPGYGSMWRHDGASGTLMRFDPQTGDVAGLTPLPGLNRHEGAVTSIAAGAGGVWLTVARYY
jgi:streptogramin lyase